MGVARGLSSEAGTTLPLLIGAGFLALMIALSMFNAATIFSLKQELQFEADQLALALFREPAATKSQLLIQAGLNSYLNFSSFKSFVLGNDAQVVLCTSWQAPVKIIGLPIQSNVCTKSTAR